MHELLTSLITVVLAELGDKTQLLALLLAARFKKPIPIILGITVATLLNHTFASLIGVWLASLINPPTLRLILAFVFIAMGIWICIPDKIDEAQLKITNSLNIFVTTSMVFFLAEMGDKTQIATVALAAHYQAPLLVIVGTPLGMLAADIPAVLIGNTFAQHLPLRLIRIVAALIFITIGVVSLIYQ